MRIVCPDCSASYDVPEARLVGRRSLRCTRCGTRWAPELEVEPVVAEPPPPPALEVPQPLAWEPEPYVAFALRAEPPPVDFAYERERAAPRAAWAPPPEPRRSLPESLPAGLTLKLAWAGSVAVVLGVLTALLLGHDSVAASWPPAQRLYALLGLGAT